jgi:hypothetical protein
MKKLNFKSSETNIVIKFGVFEPIVFKTFEQHLNFLRLWYAYKDEEFFADIHPPKGVCFSSYHTLEECILHPTVRVIPNEHFLATITMGEYTCNIYQESKNAYGMADANCGAHYGDYCTSQKSLKRTVHAIVNTLHHYRHRKAKEVYSTAFNSQRSKVTYGVINLL